MIGGNVTAALQASTPSTNGIGEMTKTWATVQTLHGWLDLTGGEARYTTYNAKMQESTHVFVCDYVPLKTTTEHARMVIDNAVYDVTLMDNPMGLNQHWEIYLRYTGGQ